jgi:hypothetical protein
VGKLIPGVEIRLVEERAPDQFVDAPCGEIWVKRSKRFMKGYVEGTEVEGRMTPEYYRTGDIGRLDEDGYLELFGRNDDFVMVGGTRIHPAEVENVLLSMPGIVEAAFVCERNEETGAQATRAYVVLDPASKLDVSQIDARLRAELPPSRWPQRIEISAGLPRTDTGKLSRRSLIQRQNERLVASARIFVHVGESRIPGRLLDASRNGCRALVEGPVAVGPSLSVTLAARPEVRVEGTCRTCAPDEGGQGHVVNIEFAEGSDGTELLEHRSIGVA